MPRKRKDGKRVAGAWLPGPLYDALKKQSDLHGVAVSVMVTRYIEDGLGKREKDNGKQG